MTHRNIIRRSGKNRNIGINPIRDYGRDYSMFKIERRVSMRLHLTHQEPCVLYKENTEFDATILNVSEEGMLLSIPKTTNQTFKPEDRIIFQCLDNDEVVCGYLIIKYVNTVGDDYQVGCYYHKSLYNTELLNKYLTHKLTEQILEEKWA